MLQADLHWDTSVLEVSNGSNGNRIQSIYKAGNMDLDLWNDLWNGNVNPFISIILVFYSYG